QVLLQRVVPVVIAAARAEAAHLTPDQRDAMLVEFEVKTRHDTGKGETVSGVATFLLGYMVALILYMVITLYGVSVMRSVVTEKSSRVIELMVAATNPRAMMSGKILGVGGAGLAQIALWLLVGGVALGYQSELLGAFGVKGGAGLPPLSAIQLGVIAAFFV